MGILVLVTVSSSNIDDFNVDKYNPQVRNFVAKLPGITSKNVFVILNHCENLLDLIEMSEVRTVPGVERRNYIVNVLYM